jgi:hypothetical protein
VSPSAGSVKDNAHNLGGSPSKFDPARRTIARDTGYLTQLTTRQLEELRRVAGKQGSRWGYV